MTSLPPGVSAYDEAVEKEKAAENFVALVFGGPKTGKTHWALRSAQPLHLAYLDTNPGLPGHLLRLAKEVGDNIDTHVWKVPPYSKLSEEVAQAEVKRVEDYAEWCISEAYKAKAAGKPGGTFMFDGALMLKGLYEKLLLGESVTLGYRPGKGGRSFRNVEYAKPNAALFELVSRFAGVPMDAIFIFEGRSIYKDTWEDGKKTSTMTDKWRSSRPARIPYAVNTEIECLMAMERANPADNTSPLLAKPKIRIVYNSEQLILTNLVLDAKGYSNLKSMMLTPVLGKDALEGAQAASTVMRANTEEIPGDD